MKFGLKTIFVLITLAALFCTSPDWFLSVAIAVLAFGLYFKACAQVGTRRRRSQILAPYKQRGERG
jgi:hypothetical protein